MFSVFKAWTDSLDICAEKLLKSGAQQHPSTTPECYLHPCRRFQDPIEQSPEKPCVIPELALLWLGSRTWVLPDFSRPPNQPWCSKSFAELQSWQWRPSLCLPAVGAELPGCHGHKVSVSAFPSAALLSVWFGSKVKKKEMRWLLRLLFPGTVVLQCIGIVQGRATWADISAQDYIYHLFLFIGV